MTLPEVRLLIYKQWKFTSLLINLMNRGGFTLRKWNSNSKELREKIELKKTSSTAGSDKTQEWGSPANKVNRNLIDGSTTANESSKSDERYCVKILGTNWDVRKDELECDITDLLTYVKSFPRQSALS